MPMRQLSSPAELQEYDRWVKSHPHGTLWQSLEWKAYQETLGREVRIYAEGEDAITTSALVIIDTTAFGLTTWDIPRGPIGMKNEECRMKNFSDEILQKASFEKCISLFYSPPKSILHSTFFIHNSPRTEQPPATRLIDLTQSEEQILAQMKQKGRYNIRLAEKHDVIVEQSTDIEAFTRLAAETARRDGFTAPPASRYQKFLQSLPGAFLVLAYPTIKQTIKPCPIAGLLGAIWNGTGIYYYGASDYAHRSLMAPYLLQWKAMKLCKAAGCHTYDLLGIAPPATSNQQPDISSWSGISRFKEQFGGTIVEYPPEQQIILKPIVNCLLQIKRHFLA